MGTKITDSGKKGDLRIAFGFKKLADFSMPQPVMYLYAARSPQVMVDIPLPLLYLFDYRDKDKKTGDPEALSRCKQVAEVVYGAFPTVSETHRVLDAITDFATDLKNMPLGAKARGWDSVQQHLETKGYDFVEHC